MILCDWQQGRKTFLFSDSLFDEFGIVRLKIGKNSQFVDICIVTYVCCFGEFRVCLPPLFCGTSEESNIEEISFVCIGEPFGVFGIVCLGKYVIFDRVGLNKIVGFGKEAFGTSFDLLRAVFICLEPLIFFDEVEFERRTDCRTKFKGDIFVCVCPPITAAFDIKSYCIGFFNPFSHTEREHGKSGLHSKVVEFDHFKVRVVEKFPCSEKLQEWFCCEPSF